MDKNKLKDELFDAVYWYYRKQYAWISDHIEKENQIFIMHTKSAEQYSENQIKELIKKLQENE